MIIASTEDDVYNSGYSDNSTAWLDFTGTHEGPWWVRVDKRTGLPALAWGKGIPWIPGRGNTVSIADVYPDRSPNDPITMRDLELIARDFIDRHPGLIGASNGDLVMNNQRSASVKTNDIWFVDFNYFINNIEVLGARIFFRINNGNLIQFGTKYILPSPDTDTTPVLDATHALSAAYLYLDIQPTGFEEIRDPGTLYLLPLSADPSRSAGGNGDLFYRLVYRVSFKDPGGIRTWVGYIDAKTGDIISMFDDNRYACYDTLYQGQVTGGVFGQLDNPASSPETIKPFPFTLVDDDGTPIETDFNGIFPYSGKTASTGLNGEYFNLSCSGCNTPSQAYVEDSASGDLEFGTGGSNQTGNGYSTKAERNTFYHLNIARALGSKWLMTVPWFDSVVPANVNINMNCNAWWDGLSVNFLRGGSGCNNTGEIAGVIQHEWGHGLDQNTTGGPVNDGARGEGLGDHLAFMSSHDPRVGPYFFTGGAPVRNVDSAVSGLRTISNLGSYCSGGSGPMGYEVHCEGIIYGQVGWDLSQNLVSTYGNEVAGWAVSEYLFFSSLPTTDTYIPNQPGSSYDGYIAVDDDNGDLSDGTPNAADINAAFSLHETASTPMYASSPRCTPPVGPATTATPLIDPSTGIYQVMLNWVHNPDAAFYNILRNDTGPGDVYIPVALNILPPTTSFLDTQVSNGLTYHYVVQVVDSSACVSTNDNHVTATIALPDIVVDAYILDDSAGNGNGYIDPGESITVPLIALNRGVVTSNNTLGEIETSHPDITIIDDSFNYGTIADGATAASTAPHFTFTVANKPELCGQTMSIQVFFTSDEGCWADGISFVVGGGETSTILFDDFEADSGWTVGDPTDSASTGIWERANPRQTDNGRGFIYQPGDDHTPSPGVECWVTGNAPGGGGTDDVDDGCTTLFSPVYDLSSYTNVYVFYWRWYTNETSLDDPFVVEVSNNGGGSWQVLETVDSTTQPWTYVSINLDELFAPDPLDQIQVKFVACDNGGGSLTEALIDDFGFSIPYCEPGVPMPNLEYVGHGLDDGGTLGFGNDNGEIQPGETVHISVDLENVQNLTAETVTGTLSIDPPVPGIFVIDDTADFPDIAPGDTETSISPHFAIQLDENDTLCGKTINFDLTVHYTGGTAPYAKTFQFTEKVLYGATTTTFYFDDFEGPDDNGWTHEQVRTQDDWQRGDPEGKAGDPGTAYSGSNIWANDLGLTIGSTTWNGEYQPDVLNYLETPEIDCSAYSNVHIRFQRWLTIEDGIYDQARIYVNGNQIWQNPMGGGSDHIQDTAWSLQEYDISEYASNNPSVVVRFELESDGGLQFGGWNIDDFTIYTYDCDVIHDPTRPTATPGTPTGTPAATVTPSPIPTHTPGTPVPVTSPAGVVLMVFAMGILLLIMPQSRHAVIRILNRKN